MSYNRHSRWQPGKRRSRLRTNLGLVGQIVTALVSIVVLVFVWAFVVALPWALLALLLYWLGVI